MTAQVFSIGRRRGLTRLFRSRFVGPGAFLTGGHVGAVRRWTIPVAAWTACLLSFIVSVHGQSTTDPVERSMQFIEQSMKATDLFNEGKVKEALAVFTKLLETSPDLDEDGYVALSVGDCLAVLDRREGARAAYEAAQAAHSDLAGAVDDRLIELELAGNVSDSLLDRLRFAATGRSEKRFVAAWQLGRALQKRVQALLIEAASAFRMAAQLDSPIPKTDWQADHLVDLDDLNEQLTGVIERVERRWAELRRYLSGRQGTGEQLPMQPSSTQNRQYECTLRIAGGEQVVLRGSQDRTDGGPRFTANGKPIQLNEGQADSIRRYQERIDHILLEAANRRSADQGEHHE
ncbi:MAG TPA: hypothetical protein PKY77_17965 [Phycisphaerae bacterium]|nr:hypothetical protein [Phycisphaerae bacterium]HRY70261.1 hypothetical protein [Phycisphaerae bacterium]HSA27568.1 hypothetical protein [Phycisphaerae bacterium]